MGNQREQDAEFFYTLGELCEMTGYTPRRLNETVKRYRKRLGADGKARRCYYLKEKGIFNDDFSDWLLETRYTAPIEVEQRENAVSLREVAEAGREYGLTYKVLQSPLNLEKLGAWAFHGRYYVSREEADAVLERYRYAQAPDDWFPVVTLIDLCRGSCSPQAVYSWVRRQSKSKNFIHPGRSQLALFMPVLDAITYLKRAFGSAQKAFWALTKRASIYFRSLRKTVVKLFCIEDPTTPLDPRAFEITFITGEAQPPPLNPSQLGQELLSLRT
jgi:hypothetical protein